MDNLAEGLEIGERLQSLLKTLPESLWHTTTPPTRFRIRDNRAELVASNYVGQGSDLVFEYENKDGYISINKIYPPTKE